VERLPAGDTRVLAAAGRPANPGRFLHGPDYHGRMPISRTTLTDDARRFLGGLQVATIATIDDDGGPRQAVAWYRLEPDDRVLLNSRTPRRWCTNLLRDGRVSLSVIDMADPYRWVGLTGIVDEVVDDVERAREDIVSLAHRYHPEGPTPSSIATFRRQPRVSFLVRLTGVHDHLED
jgi:PPOX class probable F420-dependent enzyme